MHTYKRACSTVRRFLASCGSLGLCLAAGTASGTEVQVNDGQRLLQSDLDAGLFAGQSFTLGPATTFSINSGGIIGPIGAVGSSQRPYSFAGSTVRLDGGLFFSGGGASGESRSSVSDVRLRVLPGGTVGAFFEAGSGSDLQLAGGLIQSGADLRLGSSLDLQSGEVLGTLTLHTGSSVFQSGGVINNMSLRDPNTAFEMIGGAANSVSADASTLQGGSIRISGSSTVNRLTSSSFVQIDGGEIGRLNTFSTATVVINAGMFTDDALLRGTLAVNGGTFAGDVTLSPNAPLSIGNTEFGSTLSIDRPQPVEISRSVIGDMFASEGPVTLHDSQIGDFAYLTGLRVTGGSVVGDYMTSFGDVGVGLLLEDGSIGNDAVISGPVSSAVYGGSIGDRAEFSSEATVDVFGGQFGWDLAIGDDSTLNVHGGQFRSIGMYIGTTLNLFVTEAAVDGVPLPLTFGETVEIDLVDGAVITAELADGGSFNFQMNILSWMPGRDFVSHDTVITATLVPSPGSAMALAIGLAALPRRRRR